MHIYTHTGTQTSTAQVLLGLCRETNASAVFFNRDVTPAGHTSMCAIQNLMSAHAIQCHASHGVSLLYEPDKIPVKTGFHGGHWGTLMPFLRACTSTSAPPRCEAVPVEARAPEEWPTSCSVSELGLANMPTSRTTGEVGVRICVDIQVCIRICVDIHMCIHMCVYIHICMYVYVQICIYIYTYI